MQEELARSGGQHVFPPLEKIAGADVIRSSFTITEEGEMKPKQPLVIRSTKGETREVSNNMEMAQAAHVSKDMQRRLYADTADEREAYAVTAFIKAQMSKLLFKEERSDADADAREVDEDYITELLQERDASLELANALWAPDREPQRFIGPPTNFLNGVQKFLL